MGAMLTGMRELYLLGVDRRGSAGFFSGLVAMALVAILLLGFTFFGGAIAARLGCMNVITDGGSETYCGYGSI